MVLKQDIHDSTSKNTSKRETVASKREIIVSPEKRALMPGTPLVVSYLFAFSGTTKTTILFLA